LGSNLAFREIAVLQVAQRDPYGAAVNAVPSTSSASRNLLLPARREWRGPSVLTDPAGRRQPSALRPAFGASCRALQPRPSPRRSGSTWASVMQYGEPLSTRASPARGNLLLVRAKTRG